jgi:hypothetical protein
LGWLQPSAIKQVVAWVTHLKNVGLEIEDMLLVHDCQYWQLSFSMVAQAVL